MKFVEINSDSWEAAEAGRSNWCQVMQTRVKKAEARREKQWQERRERQRARATLTSRYHYIQHLQQL